MLVVPSDFQWVTGCIRNNDNINILLHELGSISYDNRNCITLGKPDMPPNRCIMRYTLKLAPLWGASGTRSSRQPPFSNRHLFGVKAAYAQAGNPLNTIEITPIYHLTAEQVMYMCNQRSNSGSLACSNTRVTEWSTICLRNSRGTDTMGKPYPSMNMRAVHV